ncbi:aspartate/glutamate racemase family protein [Xylophilus sp. GOD-11R]|uniref:aspartate/glutamate racemase family protein n=1 Tax=Xylophilus sp. GOD-11R TaxID=3089814 RepID=UPI00298BCF24|nr:aspartate/glutamate racemase family protein [Xylophilus sp. GOD-11R]WPB57849.1 aspartate/glutamate racemase family protein [Xylophilus sp. GOD-11R]
MRRLLVINPNTSAHVSSLLQTHVAAIAGPGVQVSTVTARLGAPYIANEASYAVAAHATLDAWASALVPPAEAPDAVLIGCFGDPGLFALRESSPVPITGLAEAAFMQASRAGRFAVVTGGATWDPMLRRLAWGLGHGEALAGVVTVAPSGAQLAEDPEGAKALLVEACRQAAALAGVQSVIVGGAGLAGMAEVLQGEVGVRLIDSVAAGAQEALRAMESPGAPGAHCVAGCDVTWSGVSAELRAFGRA